MASITPLLFNTVEFQLKQDPDFSGETRTSSDIYGPTAGNAGFPMTYAIVHVVHGRWKPVSSTSDNPSQPVYASLIFRPQLRLEASPLSEPKDDPWIAHFEPAGKGKRYITESQSKITNAKTFGVSANLDAAPAPITGGVTYTDATTEEFTKIRRYEISAAAKKSQSRGAGRKGRDEVEWVLDEEEGKGLGDRLQVAVLIGRDNTKPFTIELTLKNHIDLAHSVEKFFHGKNVFNETFYPGREGQNRNVPIGIDPTELSRTELDGTLDSLAYEHSGEKWESAKLYPEVPESKTIGSGTAASASQNDSVPRGPALESAAVRTASLTSATTASGQSNNFPQMKNETQIDEDENALELKLVRLQIQETELMLKLVRLRQKQAQKMSA